MEEEEDGMLAWKAACACVVVRDRSEKEV